MSVSHPAPSLAIDEHLTPVDLLRLIGHHRESIQESEEEVTALCPIHRDVSERTLRVSKQTHRFRCSLMSCPGNEGGDLIDLYAKARGIRRDEAVTKLSRHARRAGRSHAEEPSERHALRPAARPRSRWKGWLAAVAAVGALAGILWFILIELGFLY